MAHILVVGATGQLGTRCVEAALAAGHRVRALVRPGSRHAHLVRDDIECVRGDLRDAGSLASACDGIDAVMATATVVFPRGRYSFAQDEGRGYRNLVEACRARGVDRILFVSIAMPFTRDYLASVPTLRMKAHCEALLKDSGVDYTVFRCTPFMDDYFALMGSRLPLQGEVAATLDRASGATRALRSLFGASIERWGLATVPGPASHRHAFVAVDDVARCMVSALDEPKSRGATIELTGPEEASWREVADFYAVIFRRRVRVLSLPAWLLRACAWLARPMSEAATNQLRLLQVLAEQQTRVQRRGGMALAMPTTGPRAYLSAKASARGPAGAAPR